MANATSANHPDRASLRFAARCRRLVVGWRVGRADGSQFTVSRTDLGVCRARHRGRGHHTQDYDYRVTDSKRCESERKKTTEPTRRDETSESHAALELSVLPLQSAGVDLTPLRLGTP